MNLSNRIALNAVTTWLSTAVGAAVQLLIVPFLIARLGKEGYGLVALCGAIVGFAVMIDLGVRHSLSRHLAELIALKNDRRITELFSSALACYAAIGGLLMLGCVTFAETLVGYFQVPEALRADAVFLVRYYASATIILSFIAPCYEATLNGSNRFDLWNYVHIVEVLLRAVGIIVVMGWVIERGDASSGLRAWAAVMFAAQITGIALFRFLARRICAGLRFRPGAVKRDALAELFRLGRYLFVYETVQLLAVRADPFILTSFLGPKAVGLYQPAILFVAGARPFVGALAKQLRPLATGLHATGQKQQLQELLIRGSRLTFLMGSPFCIVLAVFALPIVRLWLGDGFEATAWVLALWAMVDLTEYGAGPQWHVMLGMNRVRFIVAVRLAAAVLNLGASILLVRWMSRGEPDMDMAIVGVVIPTVVLGVAQRVVITLHVAAATEVPLRRYIAESYFRPLVTLGLLTAVCLTLRLVAAPQSLLAVASCVAAPLALWGPLCWWLALDDKDKKGFQGVFQSALARFGLPTKGV